MSIRRWEEIDGWYTQSIVGVEHPSVPPQKKHVRGMQNPSLLRAKDVIPGKSTRLELMLNVDLRVSCEEGCENFPI